MKSLPTNPKLGIVGIPGVMVDVEKAPRELADGMGRAACVSRFRTREPLERPYRFLPESQGQNLALTVIYVPYSLDSGSPGYGEPRIG
jgi:hypothetical protein